MIRTGLDFLNGAGRHSDVARLVEAMGYKSRYLRGVLTTALSALVDSGHVDQVRAYVERIPDKHAKNLRTDGILRLASTKTDTETFVSTLQTADVDEVAERKKWLLDPRLLVQVFESKEGLGKV